MAMNLDIVLGVMEARKNTRTTLIAQENNRHGKGGRVSKIGLEKGVWKRRVSVQPFLEDFALLTIVAECPLLAKSRPFGPGAI
ncbi:MAG: hypothetical protein ACE5GT_06815 [Rhodospirillales bacterium]